MNKHNQEHINLIADYLAGVSLDLLEVQKARYLKDNCKECNKFFEDCISLDHLISRPEFQDKIWKVLKKEDQKKYDYLINVLAKSEKGLDIIWQKEVVKKKIAGLGKKTAKIDYDTKRAFLENLGILRTKTKIDRLSQKKLVMRLSYASPLSAVEIERILSAELKKRRKGVDEKSYRHN